MNSDTYPHSERELLCSSGQVVILCFKPFALTVKNLSLYAAFCAQTNTSQQGPLNWFKNQFYINESIVSTRGWQIDQQWVISGIWPYRYSSKTDGQSSLNTIIVGKTSGINVHHVILSWSIHFTWGPYSGDYYEKNVSLMQLCSNQILADLWLLLLNVSSGITLRNPALVTPYFASSEVFMWTF